MMNYVEKAKGLLNKNKKKIIIGTSIVIVSVVGLFLAGFAFLYNQAKSNTNYTIDQAQAVALQVVEGDVLRVNKKIELESLSFEYEFEIKDKNNILREVTVDSKSGVITDLDN